MLDAVVLKSISKLKILEWRTPTLGFFVLTGFITNVISVFTPDWIVEREKNRTEGNMIFSDETWYVLPAYALCTSAFLSLLSVIILFIVYLKLRCGTYSRWLLHILSIISICIIVLNVGTIIILFYGDQYYTFGSSAWLNITAATLYSGVVCNAEYVALKEFKDKKMEADHVNLRL